ncbi:MAG TPA: response regulator, partial [Solirubrobacter sp.]|nr:response regulator [Solirubrobacter sp.]
MEAVFPQDGTYTVLATERPLRWHEVVTRHGGIELGAAAAFRSAAEAVRCAVALLDTDDAPALGLDAGELRAGALGEAVPMMRATRLAQVARPGQVLVSAIVRQLVGDDPDLSFGEERAVNLPGLAGRIALHEVRYGARHKLRVVIADDAALVRDGVAALLRDHGIEVAGTASDATELHEAVARHRPDVALVDIRMPPTFTDEGLAAAERIRAGFPEVGVLVLSQHLDVRYALRVAEASPGRTGYLLKDRVTDTQVLFDALERIAAGGCVIDEAVAEGLLARASALARIEDLS